jgi:hypothetical protein
MGWALIPVCCLLVVIQGQAQFDLEIASMGQLYAGLARAERQNATPALPLARGSVIGMAVQV